MADNYLERKMEDYRRGAAAGRRLTHSGDSPGTLRMRLRPRPVLIYDAAGECDETLISLLTGAGFRVAFTMADAQSGRRLAQRIGALFLPEAEGAEEIFLRRCGGIKATILKGSESAEESGCCVCSPNPTSYALRRIADLIENDER